MVLFLLSAVLLAPGLEPAPSPQPPLELRVVSDCRTCTAEDLSFHTFWHLESAPIVIQRSTLEVEDQLGKLLFVVANPFCRQPGERMSPGNGTSNCGAPALVERLAALPAGTYAVTWRLNQASSNTASFRLGPAGEPLVPLVIEPLLRHGEAMPQPEILAHFTNTGSASVGLPSLWGGSSVIVDGESCRRSGWMWSGTATLGSGESWGVVVPVAEYGSPRRCAARAGRHQVCFVMGGIPSNEITIEIARDLCGPRLR